MNNLRFACRQLLNNPGFTAVAVLTLALGIGANTAIFSVINAILLKPLVYRAPERLVRIYSEFPHFPNGGLRRFAMSIPEYLDLRRESTSWESMGAWTSGGVNIAGSEQPVRGTLTSVTGELLPSLGVGALLGRALTPEDDAPGGARVAALSYGLWQRMFAGDPSVLGRSLLVDGNRFSVVGVMPKDFRFPAGEADPTDLWTPMQIDPARPGGRAEHNLQVIGRLRPGVGLEQARKELETLAGHWGTTGSGHRFDGTNHTLVCFGYQDEVVRGVRPALWMLWGAVTLLLLIACVNVANLLLARAEARQREIAIRAALGAGLARFGMQFLTEGILLAGAGVGAGLLLAYGGLELLKSASLASLPRAAEIRIDHRVVFFAVALSLVTGLGFGLTPLIQVLRRNWGAGLKSGSYSTSTAIHVQRFRQALVVGQLALSLTLFVGTGLMLRGFWRLQDVSPGFNPDRLVTMSIALPASAYRGPDVRNFWMRIKERVESLPGVESVALASGLPPLLSSVHNDTLIEGYVPREGAPLQNVEYYQTVSPGYFETMKVRLVEGRFFETRDGAEAPEVAMINQTMARTFWTSESPVGRRIRPGGTTNWCTIIGVIADTKNGGLDRAAGTELYVPYTQRAGWNRSRRMSLVIKSPGNVASIVSGVRRELAAMDSTLPLSNVQTMEDVVSVTRSRPRLLTLMLTLFTGVALSLAVVGIYGVISYAVARGTKEFGLRMALGAQRQDVLRLVMRRGMLLVGLGLSAGVIGALMLTRFLSSLLFEITPTDPSTFVVASVVFGGVALIGAYVPARRAMQVHPLEALRHE